MFEKRNTKKSTPFGALTVSFALSTILFSINVKETKAESVHTCLNKTTLSMAASEKLNNSILDENLIAKRRRYIVRRYYSDSTFTTPVGTGTFRCDGSSTLTGISTRFYKIVLNAPCCGDFLC